MSVRVRRPLSAVDNALGSLIDGLLATPYLDFAALNYTSLLMQVLAQRNGTSLLPGRTRAGGPNFNAVGGTPLMGSARRMPPVLQARACAPRRSCLPFNPRSLHSSPPISSNAPLLSF